jgi:E3 ubiquitin-protein ligase HECTD1
VPFDWKQPSGQEGEADQSYPSVNTCHHYVKMPEYSDKERLKEKLLRAVETKGFHLN